MGRSCDEIRAIVETSPHWATFVGDGASIPWEWFPMPYALMLAQLKQDLDRVAPEAFRLHDFLYDLRSLGLGITRAEADDCLEADLIFAAPAVALMVSGACRAFGGIWFHTTHNPTFSNIDNMGFTKRSQTVGVFKCTMFCEIATNRSGEANPAVTRVAGWSESFYIRDVTIAEAKLFLIGPSPTDGSSLCVRRAALLPISGRISGQRVQEVGVRGGGQSLGRAFAGNSGYVTDVPFMALLCKAVPTGGGKARTFTIGGIPDSQVTDGEFTPSTAFRNSLQRYFEQVGNFASKSRSDVINPFPIVSVDGTGKLRTVIANDFAVNEMVKVTGTKDALNVARSGTYRVLNIQPLTFDIDLQGWNWGVTAGGTVDHANTAYVNFGNAGVIDAVRIKARKVGRPFNQYRGRRSKRRARA